MPSSKTKDEVAFLKECEVAFLKCAVAFLKGCDIRRKKRRRKPGRTKKTPSKEMQLIWNHHAFLKNPGIKDFLRGNCVFIFLCL